MNKSVIQYAALALVGVGIGIAIWAVVFQRGDQPAPEPGIIDREFSEERFFALFDVDGSGEVTFEVFESLYNTEASEKFLVSPGPNRPALTAREAFDALDRDGDGVITSRDFIRDDRDSERFREDAHRRGLTVESGNGRMLALDQPRLIALGDERAADELGQFPFHGRYFDRTYFGTWGEVELEDGTRVEGYVRESHARERFVVLMPVTTVWRMPYDEAAEQRRDPLERINVYKWASPAQGNVHDGRVFPAYGRVSRTRGDSFDRVGFILIEDGELFIAEARAMLQTFRREEVTLRLSDDSPRNEYARRITGIHYTDEAENAELAAKCVEWGLYPEAIQLYLRVLIFDPTHAEARRFMGVRSVEGHFRPVQR
jgi:hypothetical protein